MSRHVVFVHGRSQQRKDAVALKAEWVQAWEQGLRQTGLGLPLADADIRFPYYGDTLVEMEGGRSEDEAAEVIIRGDEPEQEEQAVMHAILDEARRRAGVEDDAVRAEADDDTIERGPLNWGWVRAIVSALDRVPGLNGAAVALATHDVYTYLTNPVVREIIDTGACAAIPADRETVVVGHSLGSVVAYNILDRDGEAMGWQVPLFVTVGSPLGVTALRKWLRRVAHPACAAAWFNAMDPQDIVALHPLDHAHFAADPAIENKIDVDNGTPNQHGISGYLSDPVVAARLHAAVTAP
jgi:hypothetical protein